MLALHHPGYEGFVRTEPTWRALSAASQAPRFQQTYDWYAPFFEHLCPADEPAGVLELQHEGRCAVLLPYQRKRIKAFGVNLAVVALPSSPHLILTDVLLDGDALVPGGLSALRRCLAQAGVGWHALLFAHVLEDSHALRFAETLRGVIVRPAGGSCDFDTTHPYPQLSEQFAGRLRKTLKKGRNRLDQAGTLEFLSITAGEERMAWAYERFLALEASGWKGETGTGSAIALSEAPRRFYRDLATMRAGPMRIEIRLLCLDGEPIAAQFASVCGSRRSVHKIAYDESFQHGSPGTLLMAHTIECSCRDERIESLSLVTDMPWMRDWNAHRTPVYDVWVPRNSALGLVAQAALNGKRLLQRRRRRAREADADTPHARPAQPPAA